MMISFEEMKVNFEEIKMNFEEMKMNYMNFEEIPTKPLAIAIIIGAIYTGSRIDKVQFVIRGFISLILIFIFSAYGSIIAILFSIIGKRGLINYVTARSYGFFASLA